MKTDSAKKFKNKLMIQLSIQFLIAVILCGIMLFLLLMFLESIGLKWVVSFFSPLLRFTFGKFFLETLYDYREYLFILFCGMVVFAVVIFFFRRILGYLEKVVSSIEHLFDDNMELVQFPGELKAVEDRLNQIKYTAQKNEYLAMEAEQRKNDLVVYLAHDLKTPLTSVIGYLTLLRDEQKISDELREKYLAISLEKAERLEELINEFFEITRFSLKNIALELARINLTMMLEQIAYEFNPLLVPKKLACSVNVDKDIIIHGDAKKLERVFDNLIRNAINYSFENSEIQISAVKSEQGVSIKFRNLGNTIPKQKLDRIFEQFYRLDTARTTKNGGAGLGLAIAKEIIELHKGKIKAFSENEIIEFEIFLPALS